MQAGRCDIVGRMMQALLEDRRRHEMVVAEECHQWEERQMHEWEFEEERHWHQAELARREKPLQQM